MSCDLEDSYSLYGPVPELLACRPIPCQLSKAALLWARVVAGGSGLQTGVRRKNHLFWRVPDPGSADTNQWRGQNVCTAPLSRASARYRLIEKEGPRMPRQGYLIVSNKHRLFPDVAARKIEARARDIIGAITATHVAIPHIAFTLTPMALGGRSEAKVAEALFSGSLLPNVRVIFARTALSPRRLTPRFRDLSSVFSSRRRGAAQQTLCAAAEARYGLAS